MKNSPSSRISGNVRNLTFAAVTAALVCAATMVIQIPSPVNGYIHPGDVFVLLGAFILHPAYGAAAAGIGAMLADVFTGYLHYVPGTFVIKAVMAAAASLIFRLFRRKGAFAAFVSGIAAEAVMILGYFVYEWFLLGMGPAAATGVPGNAFQGGFAVLAASVISAVLGRMKAGRNLFHL